VLATLAILSLQIQAGLLQRIVDGKPPTVSEGELNDLYKGIISLLYFLTYVTGLVLFMVWIHRAHKNLRALGADCLRFSPGWTVGYFFIPIVFLFRPYQATKEIWKASDPALADAHPLGWMTAPGAAILKFWWAAWLVSDYVSYNSLTTTISMWGKLNPTVYDFIAETRISQISDLLTIISLSVTLALMWRITRRQDAKNVRVSSEYAAACCSDAGNEVI
jgi:asparagine N-glycosylation enzyme membrane subunit Stt3